MAFGKTKQNFKPYQWVRIGAVGGDPLEGVLGMVLGKSFDDAICDHYIVLLSVKMPYSDNIAITMTEACLEPVDVVCRAMDRLRTSPDGSG